MSMNDSVIELLNLWIRETLNCCNRTDSSHECPNLWMAAILNCSIPKWPARQWPVERPQTERCAVHLQSSWNVSCIRLQPGPMARKPVRAVTERPFPTNSLGTEAFHSTSAIQPPFTTHSLQSSSFARAPDFTPSLALGYSLLQSIPLWLLL